MIRRSTAGAPRAGRPVLARGAPSPALRSAIKLLRSLGADVVEETRPGGPGVLEAAGQSVVIGAASAAEDWAWSGAMALTGPADGPPSLAPGAPASAVRGALAVLDLCTRARGKSQGPGWPDGRLLGERAAVAGLTRRAPTSVGGSFHALLCGNGWVGVSLARSTDLAAVPAVVQSDARGDPITLLENWARSHGAAEVAERLQLLSIPAGVIPADRLRPRRAPVLVAHTGGPRPLRSGPPLVVDLSALWAGPLCAHLLGLGGARVVKVEDPARPDGARSGPPAFYDLLHAGHASVALDFGSGPERAVLRRLVSHADVVLVASRPRVARHLGIDPRRIVDEGGIWISLTAYGCEGPDADRVGFGDDVAAAAGLVASTHGLPYPVGDAVADPLAGTYAAAAAAAALLGDRGVLLDVSMFDVAVAGALLPGDPDAAVRGDAVHGWEVVTGAGAFRVAEPRARRPSATAAPLGAHTNAVLSRIGHL